jgi:anti-sigma factor RsiW
MNKACNTTRRQFDQHLRGALEKGEEAKVQDHLKGCAECRAELDLQASMARGLREVFSAKVPDDLADRAYRAAMNADDSHGVEDIWRALFPVALPAAATASVCAIALCLWAVIQPSVAGADVQADRTTNTEALWTGALAAEDSNTDTYLLKSFGLGEAKGQGGQGS